MTPDVPDKICEASGRHYKPCGIRFVVAERFRPEQGKIHRCTARRHTRLHYRYVDETVSSVMTRELT